jgi:hypothetical protein
MPADDLPPKIDGLCDIREKVRPIDTEYRLIADFDISFILKKRDQEIDMPFIVFKTVFMFNEDGLILLIPAPRPILICPAKTKGKIRFTGGQYFIYGPV